MAQTTGVPVAPQLEPPSSEGTPPPGLQEQQMGIGGQGVRPEKTEAWWTKVDLGKMQGLIGTPDFPGSVPEKMAELYDENFGTKQRLTAAQANALYPDMDTPFTGEVTPAVAATRYDRVRQMRVMQAWINDSTQPLNWMNNLSSGMASTVLSPGDLLAGFGVGRLVGGAAKALGFAAQAGLKGLATVYGENLVGNIAIQAPNYYLRKEQGQQVSAADELESAATNALLFTGLHYAWQGLKGVAKNASGSLMERGFKEAVAQTESGLALDSSRLANTLDARAAGESVQGTAAIPYNREGMAHPSERAFYQGVSPDTQTAIDYGGYGGSSYIDEPNVARNSTANPEGADQGHVIQGQVHPDAKLLDLDTGLESPEAMTFAKTLEQRLGVDLDLKSSDTLKDIMARVEAAGAHPDEPSMLSRAETVAREQGFDGYKYTQEVNGEPHHNGVTLFDEQGFTPSGEQPVIPGETPPHPNTPPDLTNDNPTRAADYDPAFEQQVKAQDAQIPKTDSELDAVTKQQEMTARRILSGPEVSPATVEAVSEIDRQFSENGQVQKALKGFMDCFTKGIT